MLTKVKREVSNELEFLSLKSNKVVRSVKGTFLNHVPVNKGGMGSRAADAGHILPLSIICIGLLPIPSLYVVEVFCRLAIYIFFLA